MPSPDFNIGTDWSLDLYDPFIGGMVTISIVTGFSKQQETNALSSIGLDGVTRRYSIPTGWTGTIEYDRADAVVDRYIAAREAAHRRKEVLPSATLTETIVERDGTITQFRYEGVDVVMSEGGAVRGDDKVSQTLAWTASSREIV